MRKSPAEVRADLAAERQAKADTRKNSTAQELSRRVKNTKPSEVRASLRRTRQGDL